MEEANRSILRKALGEFESQDPDLLITKNGDSFVLPYLYEKARRHSVALKCEQGRVVREL